MLEELFPDESTRPQRIRPEGEEMPPPKKRRERPSTPVEDDGTVYFCDVCNLPCTSRLIYDSHLAGKSHASR